MNKTEFALRFKIENLQEDIESLKQGEILKKVDKYIGLFIYACVFLLGLVIGLNIYMWGII